MATHDYVIDNQTSASARADINSVLQAIVSNNSSSSEPSDTFANMFWYDTANNFLKMRSESDSEWIIIGYIDQATNQFDVRTDVIQAVTSGGTSVKNSSGSTILDLKPTAQATAEAGTNNTEIMTPLRTSQAIAALGNTGLTHISTNVLSTNGNTISVSSLSSYRRVKCFFLLNTDDDFPQQADETITFSGVNTSGTARTIMTLGINDLKTGEGGASLNFYARGIFGQLDVTNMNNGVSDIYKHGAISYGLSQDQLTTSGSFSGGGDEGSVVGTVGHHPASVCTYDETWNGIRITRGGGQFRADNLTYLSVWGE